MKRQLMLFIMGAAIIVYGGTILSMDNQYMPLSQKTFNKAVSAMTTKYREHQISSSKLNTMIYKMFKKDYTYQLSNPGMRGKNLADHYLELIGEKYQLLPIFEASLKDLLKGPSSYKDRIQKDLMEIEGRL